MTEFNNVGNWTVLGRHTEGRLVCDIGYEAGLVKR